MNIHEITYTYEGRKQYALILVNCERETPKEDRIDVMDCLSSFSRGKFQSKYDTFLFGNDFFQATGAWSVVFLSVYDINVFQIFFVLFKVSVVIYSFTPFFGVFFSLVKVFMHFKSFLLFHCLCTFL